ncbi:MAG: luciferase family protein [Granulosicoccaceae bacterium]
MPKLKEQLIEIFTAMPNVSVERWKNTELLGVNYKGKEVAHFQTGSNNELDIRLSPAIIKREKLTKAEGTKSHPDRSLNSRWIVMGFKKAKDLEKMAKLVKLAIELR